MHAGERRVMSLDEGWGSMQVRAGVRSRCWCGTTWGRDVRHQGGYARRDATGLTIREDEACDCD